MFGSSFLFTSKKLKIGVAKGGKQAVPFHSIPFHPSLQSCLAKEKGAGGKKRKADEVVEEVASDQEGGGDASIVGKGKRR